MLTADSQNMENEEKMKVEGAFGVCGAYHNTWASLIRWSNWSLWVLTPQPAGVTALRRYGPRRLVRAELPPEMADMNSVSGIAWV